MSLGLWGFFWEEFEPGYGSAVIGETADTFSAPAKVIVRGPSAFTDPATTFVARGSIQNPPAPTQPPAPMPPPAPSDAGGGKGRGKGKNKPASYVPSPQDLWDAREIYLESIQPAPTPAPRPEEYEAESNRAYIERQEQIATLGAQRSASLIAMQSATDIKTLKSLGAKVKELTAKIASLTAKQSVARFLQ